MNRNKNYYIKDIKYLKIGIKIYKLYINFAQIISSVCLNTRRFMIYFIPYTLVLVHCQLWTMCHPRVPLLNLLGSFL